jgi:hypothetical protein
MSRMRFAGVPFLLFGAAWLGVMGLHWFCCCGISWRRQSSTFARSASWKGSGCSFFAAFSSADFAAGDQGCARLDGSGGGKTSRTRSGSVSAKQWWQTVKTDQPRGESVQVNVSLDIWEPEIRSTHGSTSVPSGQKRTRNETIHEVSRDRNPRRLAKLECAPPNRVLPD